MFTHSLSDALFEKIYRLAKKKDKKGLNKLVQQGYCLGVCKGSYNTPLSLLAREGEHEAVTFLIDNFKVNISEAAFGYAAGNHQKECDDLTREYGIPELIIISGKAMGGHLKAKDIPVSTVEMEKIDDNIKTILYSFGRGQHYNEYGELREKFIPALTDNELLLTVASAGDTLEVDKLKHLVEENADNLDNVLNEYAWNGHLDAFNKLCIQYHKPASDFIRGLAFSGFSHEINAVLGEAYLNHLNLSGWLNQALGGFAMGGHFDQVNTYLNADSIVGLDIKSVLPLLDHPNVLRSLSFIDSTEKRELLVHAYQAVHPEVQLKPLLKMAEKLNLLLREYHLNYKEAYSYLTLAANSWVFQGQQLVLEEKFPAEIYFRILSFVVNCSEMSSVRIFEVANIRLNLKMREEAHQRSHWILGLFPIERFPREIERDVEEAERRYAKRVRF